MMRFAANLPGFLGCTFVLGLILGYCGTVRAAGEAEHAPVHDWSWTGLFGTYERASAQRGLQVYVEVCAACHGLNLVAYRNLADLGYTPEAIKAFASGFERAGEPDDTGQETVRPSVPADRFVEPFANPQEARYANNGALPPDLSLMVKSRAHGEGGFLTNLRHMLGARGSASGADYVYALLTGYGPKPDDLVMGEGMSYNQYFPGGQIAMAAPLYDDLIEYADGTPATVEQMSHDVTTFLAWTAEPKLEQRKQMGLSVMLFLVFLLLLTVATKRRIWGHL
ncbi:MAG: cytochrome c1, partial [Pseudomonadota bacterium]